MDCINCKFKVQYGFQLEEHLKNSSRCQQKYFNFYKKKSLSELLSHLFQCIYCNLDHGCYLIPHLRKSANCRASYARRFKIEAVGESLINKIAAQIRNIKRNSFSSRQQETRRQERTGLKNFLVETKLGKSVFKCETCKLVGTSFQVEELSVDKRRLCKNCQENIMEQEDRQLFLKGTCVTKDDQDRLFLAPENGIQLNEDADTTISFLIPTAPLTELQIENFSRNPIKPPTDLIHKKTIYIEDLYDLTYENEFKKLQDNLKFSHVLPGDIYDGVGKKIVLERNKKFVSSKIVGTPEYFDRAKSNFQTVVSQLGSIFFLTTVEIPDFSLGVCATQMHSENRNDIKIDSTLHEDCRILYHVHKSHGPEELCPNDCEIVNLEDYLQGMNRVNIVTVGANLNYSTQKFRKFISYILLNEKSRLCTEYYDGTISFPVGRKCMVGKIVTWPKFLHKINSKIALRESITEETIKEYINEVEASITNTLDPLVLADKFSLKRYQSHYVSSLALKYQLCDDIVQLPSSATFLKRKVGVSPENTNSLLSEYKKFLDIMQKELLLEERYSKTVDEWLVEVEEKIVLGITLIKEEKVILLEMKTCLLIFEYEDFVDSLLSNGYSVFSSVYHTALTAMDKPTLCVVLKTEKLHNSFVKWYSPEYLNAMQSKVNIEIVGDSQILAIEKIKNGGHIEPQLPYDHSLKCYEVNHIVVSVMEAGLRLDPSKGFIHSNCTPVFVNTSKNVKLKFKKAVGDDHTNHYQELNNTEWYEIHKSQLDHYFDIEDELSHDLCLYQFIAMFEQQKNTGHEDEPTEDENPPMMVTTNDNWEEVYLPRKIITKSGIIFKRRSKPKILCYPNPKDEEEKMFSDILLFLPHNDKNVYKWTKEELEIIYDSCDVIHGVDGKGKPLTKIESTKKKLFQTYLSENLPHAVYIDID